MGREKVPAPMRACVRGDDGEDFRKCTPVLVIAEVCVFYARGSGPRQVARVAGSFAGSLAQCMAGLLVQLE